MLSDLTRARDSARTAKSLAKAVVSYLPDPIGTSVVILLKFHRDFGRYPNILAPKTFNEKVQFRKMFDRRQHLSVWADKYAVRDYVSGRIGKAVLPELYYVTSDPSDIPFDRLPEKYVVKPTHGSGWLQIVRDGARVDRQELIRHCKRWLSMNYFKQTREWAYKNITPRIIVEELLDDGTGAVPPDFKFFVFDGKARVIQVDTDRHANHKRSYYDTDWNRIDCRVRHPNCEASLPSPARLSTMIRYAEALSDNTDFVRVDLYEVNGKVYFGELTNTPGSGFSPFVPAAFDVDLGRFWNVNVRSPKR